MQLDRLTQCKRCGNLKGHSKIDTGADVTAVSETLYDQGQFRILEKPAKVLRGPGETCLNVKGMFTATLSKNNKNTTENIYVVRGLSMPLLSGTAAMALQLVARVESISLDSRETVKREFPKLFTGLGKMEGEYNIVLKPGAQPFSLSTPRRISLPLLLKVKEELIRMEQQGVISKVEGPTEWCAPMVAVPKNTGRVRMCSDLTELNKSVLREKHPLPSVEHTLGQLAGAKVFSKLDANAGFWQIPLSKESSLLTTFITPFGHYCYNRLCFGISSVPEHFLECMSRILEGLEGVLCQMDDVLIWGATQSEHDNRLRKALSRLRMQVSHLMTNVSSPRTESSSWVRLLKHQESVQTQIREAATNGDSINLKEYTTSVTSHIGKCIDDVTVSKTITTRSDQKPWMTAKVHALLKSRDSAFRAGEKTALKTARAKLYRAIREAKHAHAQRIHGHFQDSGDSRRM
ncbi:hypothetical protein QTP70_001229 [Hemibagrus guttatus]|uniref:ribonuclease H n=1 Tax=Hemibagrus guttatus TaxID=175788 RepID=A0AAE0QHV9_9TELE|nr:hypothetical protein QTP70_001229 [Hemibagrus guttatus]